MCTLVIARQVVSNQPLVLAHNRDELIARPWRPPAWQGDALHPVDLEGGGTWLGLNRAGMVVAITNRHFAEHQPGRPSRGHLCSQVLQQTSLEAGVQHAARLAQASTYNGFALVLATTERAVLLTGGGERPLEQAELPRGVSMLTSQHAPNPAVLEPDRARLADLCHAPHEYHAELRRFLADPTLREPRYAVCKHFGPYGTVCSAVITAGQHGTMALDFAPGAPDGTPYRRVR